jgi:hypothetical protein
MTKDQVNKMLSEYADLPFLSPDPEHNVRNAIDTFPRTQHFDWPDKLIARIKQVMSTPCNTPPALEFKFELLEEATKHNLAVLESTIMTFDKLSTHNKTHRLVRRRNSSRQTSYKWYLASTPFGNIWKTSSLMAANGH